MGENGSDSDYDFYLVIQIKKDINLLDESTKAYELIYGLKETPTDILVNFRSKFDLKKTRPSLERIISNEGVKLYGWRI